LEKAAGVPTRPDTLLEVVSADQVPTKWFQSRVAPRASARGLTTVFYSTSSRSADGSESLFDRVRRSNLTKEWRDGVRRHFETTSVTVLAG
jgi:predicted LPLAT superfamily acyltransferase